MIESQAIMPVSDYPVDIDLSNNYLKSKDLIPFINTFKSKIKTINFKNNSLENKGAMHMAEFFYDRNLNNCQYLNLENTKIGDKAGQLIIESLFFNLKNLVNINLSKNNLSSLTAAQLAINFEEKNLVKQLELH